MFSAHLANYWDSLVIEIVTIKRSFECRKLPQGTLYPQIDVSILFGENETGLNERR